MGTISEDGLATTIDSLPFELLAEVMLFAATDRIRKTVLSLSWVCSNWRQIAIQTPQLWVTRLPLSKSSFFDNLVKHSATALFLERSAPLLFPVRIHDIGSQSRADILPLLAAVRDAAPRWQSLSLHSNHPDSEHEILAQIPAGQLDCLETLDLQLSGSDVWGSRVFTSALRLRDVTFATDLFSPSHIVAMPWSQLTRLELVCPSPQECLDALAQCKNVSTVDILTKQWDSDVVVGAGATLEYLEVLDIQMRVGSIGEDLGPFLRQLQAPALTCLRLSLDFHYIEDHEWLTSYLTPDLALFLSHSPRLEHLNLYNCILAADMAEDIITHTPHLIQLFFSNNDPNNHIQDDFFRALGDTNTDGTHRLVPSLQTLDLGELFFDFTEAALWDMLKSRGWVLSEDDQTSMPQAQLKCVGLGWNETFHHRNDTNGLFTFKFRHALWMYQQRGFEFFGIVDLKDRKRSGGYEN
ncbi:hypothetical protein FB45DRAFT_153520 [Roridomyces roridus]|uniref:F-box domain-containing protein n=1 Tax=Roridomyces roridus TaxID=1738132 RepID=A0AAD7AXB6_9AGAR|nr:hypothetical protein FB45DRAFT_153520 [Roridomyces roridus]